MMLRLIVTTAIASIPICDCWALRERDPKPQNGLAAVENGVMDLKGRLVPNTSDPPLDKDDGFELPPPAYELHDGVPRKVKRGERGQVHGGELRFVYRIDDAGRMLA